MSYGIRRLSHNKALRPARRPLRWLKPWCEWIALLVTIGLAYTRLRMEIGSWQALLASAGVPLTVIDSPWRGRLVAHRIRQRLGEALGRTPEIERGTRAVDLLNALWGRHSHIQKCRRTDRGHHPGSLE